jgi:hypothetical protein
MASKLYISEFTSQGIQMGHGVPCAMQPPVTTQTVDYSGGVASSASFNAQTSLVRIHTDSICSIAFGTAPTATTSSARLPADTTEYFYVTPGTSLKVSAISNT